MSYKVKNAVSSNLNLANLNTKFYLLGLNFLKNFKHLLARKFIILNDAYLNQSYNYSILNLSLFYTTNYIKKIKKKELHANQQAFLNNEVFFSLLSSIISRFKINQIFIKTEVLNRCINKKHARFLLKKLKSYKPKVFIRRFNLFIDFIKQTSLYMGSLNLKLNVYLNTLSFIFKYLRKRAHVRYYSLLKKTFQIVIKSPRTKIKGVRFLIKGRLKGKTRASTHTIQIGRVPRQSFSANVEYAESTAFTSNCGTFGFRMWVYKIS